MSDWRWVDSQVVTAIHDRQLAEHGGVVGTLDNAAVDSALTRPRNLAACGDPDAASLAAAYAWGLAASHAFADGNKRTAWVAARVFLADNGYRLTFGPAEAVQVMREVAGKQMTEQQLAAWFRKRLKRAY